MNKLYATMDIGTNSVLLLISEFENGILLPKLEKIREPQLGKGLSVNGDLKSLTSEAWDRLEPILIDYRQTINRLGAKCVGVVGTQVFRKAINGKEFMSKISACLKIPAHVISGDEEALLSRQAVENQFLELNPQNLITVDIGGGSTELFFNGKTFSLPVGAMGLFEKNGVHPDPVNRKDAKKALVGIPKPKTTGPDLEFECICVGGTATTLGMLVLGMADYDSFTLDKFEVSKKQMQDWIEKLAHMTNESRRRVPGLSAARADIIIPGLCLLEALLNRWEMDSFKISTRGLRHGLVLKGLNKTEKLEYV